MKVKYEISDSCKCVITVLSENKKEEYFLGLFFSEQQLKMESIIEEYGQPNDSKIKIKGIEFNNKINILG